MEIRVKLMGGLKKKTPPGGTLELKDGSSIQKALDLLELGGRRVNAVSINGEIERDFTRVLKAEDELLVLPPVGGG